MLPVRAGTGIPEDCRPRNPTSAEIQFARIGDIHVDVFADAAGFAALGP